MNETTITVTGWLGTEVTLTEAGQVPLARFRVGSRTSRFRDGQVEWGPTTWFQVKVWRRLALHAAESLHSGDPVVVRGRFVAESWTRSDGVAVTSHVLHATSVGHDLTFGTSRFTRASDGPVGTEPSGTASAGTEPSGAQSSGAESPGAESPGERPAAA